MNVNPIPNRLLGDMIVLVTPTKTGSLETPIQNVRVERTETAERSTVETRARVCVELTVWVDRHNSTWAEFPVGARVNYGGEIFEITESRVYRAGEPHHCKFTARKTGEESV